MVHAASGKRQGSGGGGAAISPQRLREPVPEVEVRDEALAAGLKEAAVAQPGLDALEGAGRLEELDVLRRRSRVLRRATPRAVAPDERVGGGIVGQAEIPVIFSRQLRRDALGELLAELDAPLVERVDPPHDALREDAVLVERDERPEHVRGEPLGQQDVVGRLPSKTRCGTSHSSVPSARTSAAVFPNASASACAKTLAMRRSWWSPSGFSERLKPIRSHGMSRVP